MHEHELRRRVVTEMHLRKWPRIDAPCSIVQWVREVPDSDRRQEYHRIQERLTDGPADDPVASASFVAGELDRRVRIVWERHSEGSSLTLFFPGRGDAWSAASVAREAGELLLWGEAFPGAVVRATKIVVEPSDSEIEPLVPKAGFARDELISCLIGGKVRIWSDFRIQSDGYGHVLIAGNGTDPGDLSRLVQRLQELGNYRNKALLGLPVAQQVAPTLHDLEARLGALGQRVTDPEVTDDSLLARLSDLSMELVSLETMINFRMSATSAYATLVQERLAELGNLPISGFASLEDFTQRRFLPAVRTCQSTVDRVRQLSTATARFTSLLRARIETRIENQNARLLRSLERSSGRQLRLQELVEGLSVVALSYYTIGLLSYLAKGADALQQAHEADVVIAALVPGVVASAWLIVRKLKRRLLAEGR